MYRKIVWCCFVIYLFTIIAFSGNAVLFRYSNLMFVIMLAVMLLYIVSEKIVIPYKIFCFFPFVTFCLVSYIWSYNKNETWIRTSTMIRLYVLFIIVILYLAKSGAITEFIYGIAVSGILVFVYTIGTYGISGLQNLISEGDRIGGEIINENTLAIFFSYTFITLFFEALNNKRWILLIPATAIVAVIAMTGSKKGMIDIVIGMLFSIIFTQGNKVSLKKFIKISLWLILGGLILYFAWQMPIFSVMRERFEAMFSFLSGSEKIMDYSTRERQILIESGVNQFYKTPFIGIGIGATGYITESAVGFSTYLHNNYIELLASGGVIGFILYYFPILGFVIESWKLQKQSVNSKICIIFVIVSLVNDAASVQYFSKFTYIVFAITVANIIYEKKCNI